jgi:perosamine synthetase
LEKIEEVLKKRKRFAEKMYNIFEGNDNFVCQKYHDNHSFWTFGVRFLESKENWRRFHKLFLKNGGDGFWSAWKLQYQEPLMKDRVFEKRCPTLYRGLELNQCLVAETIQPQIQQYKLNYRSDRLFDRQAKALEKTIKEF